MQVGEPASVIPGAPPRPDVELEAELLSVTFKSTVRVSHAKKTIVGPHWEQGREHEIEDDWTTQAVRMRLPIDPYYSKRAAVYLVENAGGAHEVELKVKVTKSHNVGADARLIGNLRGLTIEGRCPTAVGEHRVTARFTAPPAEIQVYRGRIAWTLSVDGAGICLQVGATLAEIYFILGPPMAAYAIKGVWTEVLRFVCGRIGVAGESTGSRVEAKVAAYCHGGHELRYDSQRGRSHYGVKSDGGIFSLGRYLVRKELFCNCYDQAAAVQALTGAVGILLVWLYLRPFGYIRPTNLVGVGLCNNPFFRSDETRKVVDALSGNRTAFDNHSFVGSSRRTILDACAKPHLGTEGPEEYLADSIDDTPKLYGGALRPGKTRDIRVRPGVLLVV